MRSIRIQKVKKAASPWDTCVKVTLDQGHPLHKENSTRTLFLGEKYLLGREGDEWLGMVWYCVVRREEGWLLTVDRELVVILEDSSRVDKANRGGGEVGGGELLLELEDSGVGGDGGGEG